MSYCDCEDENDICSQCGMSKDICVICDLDINDYFEGIRSKDDYCDDCKDIIASYETTLRLHGEGL